MTTRRSVRAQSKNGKKPPPKPAETPTPAIPPRPPSAWKDGEIDPDASPLVLAKALLEDFRSDTPFKQVPALDVLTMALRGIADDAELCAASVEGTLDHSETVQRVMTRIETRARIAIEISRRMVEEGGAS